MGVKKMFGNKPSYSTMSLDIFTYVNHNIDIGTQYMDTGFFANEKAGVSSNVVVYIQW